MNENEPTGTENLDLHLTPLFGWLLRTVGDALMWSMLIPIAIGVVAAFAGQPDLIWLAVAIGPLVFASQLSKAQAPMPIESQKAAQ